MSTFEIVQMYKEAADKNAQIEILADLNACSKDDILLVLQNEGLISGIKTKQKKNPTTTDAVPLSLDKGGRKTRKKEAHSRMMWTEATKEQVRGLLREGLTVLEIAERMGLDFNQVRNAITRYALRQSGSGNAECEMSNEKCEGETAEPLKIVSLIRDYAKCISVLSAADIRNYEMIVRTFCESIIEGADKILKEGAKYGA